MKVCAILAFVILVKPTQLFAQLVLIDSGKVYLYKGVLTTETGESIVDIALDINKTKDEKVEGSLANAFPSSEEEFYIDIGNGPELVFPDVGFKKKLKKWFADDQALVDYIYEGNLGYSNLHLLVKMYNGNLPRPFEKENTQISYVPEGLTDSRDSKQYDIVQIGRQQWMAENLNYDWSCDSCPDTSLKAYCFNCEENGRLYPWQVAMKVCPPGWSLPTTADFQELFLSLGMSVSTVEKMLGMDKGARVGSRLVEGTGDTQFNAIKSGYVKKGKLKESGISANFWTATEVGFLSNEGGNSADVMVISNYNKNRIQRIDYKKEKGFSVRCIKSGYKF